MSPPLVELALTAMKNPVVGLRVPASIAAIVLFIAVLAGCSSMPPQSAPDVDVAAPQQAGTNYGSGAARYALNVVGTPYLYGGSTPDGFDCSGLVQYSYALAGLQLSRSVEGLLSNSRTVSRSRLRPGDLLFFHLNGRPNSHVGLYIGENHFVHAPSTGKFVSTASLSNPYWRQRLAGARRPVSN